MKHFIDPTTKQIYAYPDDETRLPIPDADQASQPQPQPPTRPGDMPAMLELPEDAPQETRDAVMAQYQVDRAAWQASMQTYSVLMLSWQVNMAAWQKGEDARLARNSKCWILPHLIAISDEELQALRAEQEAEAIANAPVPQVVSRFQARAALYMAGHFAAVEAYMAQPSTPMLERLAWQDAQEFDRSSATVAALAQVLGLTDADVDALFAAASAIKA